MYIEKIGKKIADEVYESTFLRKKRSLFSDCSGGCCREFVGYIDITPAIGWPDRFVEFGVSGITVAKYLSPSKQNVSGLIYYFKIFRNAKSTNPIRTPSMLRTYQPSLRLGSIKIKGPPRRGVFRCVRSGQQSCGNDSSKRSLIMTQEFGIDNYGCCKPTGFDTVHVIVGKRNRPLMVDIPLSPSGCECGFD